MEKWLTSKEYRQKYNISAAVLWDRVNVRKTIQSKIINGHKYYLDEYSEIKNHPSIGKHILSNASIFSDIIPIVYHHHEKYNGTGYPEQLAGEDIPLLARIAAVADTFDAMTSKRSYRDPLPLQVVIEEIKNCSGTQFDPEIAKIFVEIHENEYNKIQEIQKKFPIN